jgi:hypothetical protein
MFHTVLGMILQSNVSPLDRPVLLKSLELLPSLRKMAKMNVRHAPRRYIRNADPFRQFSTSTD